MLFWLGEKIEDHLRNERNRRYGEEQAYKRQKALPIMNDLCRAKLQRIAKNPAIDEIYSLLFEGQLPVTKIDVRHDCVTAFYNNGTSKKVEFATLGLVKLTNDTAIFRNNLSMPSEINWFGHISDIKSAIDKYPYLYYCDLMSYGEGVGFDIPFFSECMAVGYLLATKTGLPYIKPDYQSGSFVFPTNEKVLKSW